MITCLGWVKRGAAKAVPDKVALSKEELQDIIDEAKEKLREKEEAEREAENGGGTSSEQDSKRKSKSSVMKSSSDNDEDDDDVADLYDLAHYDSDEDIEGELMSGAGMAGVTYFASNKDDPYITLKNPDNDTEEEEDFNIKPDDNLIVAGHVDQDFSTLEISVYNEEEGSQYVHHDILLEAFPLAVEWLDFDPEDTNRPGNFVAVGTMEPYINIWDLDLVDTLEPVISLGRRKKKKPKQKSRNSEEGHSDAVLDLSWNHLVRNVLASASADHYVILWDLVQPKPVHFLRHHKDKVQSLQWHPYESQSILTGSFDKKAKVVDCRSPESNIKSWKFDAEVERVLWNHFSPYNFLASTENGHVLCCDVRTDTPVFTLKAHDDAIPGLALSSQVPGCLVTASADETVKVWDIQDNQPSFVASRDLQVGKILNTCCCPDAPFVFCFGGEKQGLKVFDITESAPVRRQFESRQRLVPTTAVKPSADNTETIQSVHEPQESVKEENPEPMEAESAADAMAALSLSSTINSGRSKKKKKKRRK